MMKYLPLIIGLIILFGFIPQAISDHPDMWPEILLDMVFPLLISLLLFGFFFHAKDKLKYVAVGKSKVVIKKSGKEIEYNWLDVERIKLNRFLGLYELKMKNEAEIYFTPYGMTTWLTGDDSEMGVIINRMKSELQI